MEKLCFYYGAMDSGKSTRIIQWAYNFDSKGLKVVTMKPEVDNKGNDYIISRAGGLKRKVDYSISFNQNIFQLIANKCSDAKLILVDEAQFLNRNQVDQLMDAKNEYEIRIVCFGLRTNFKGESFEGSSRLLSIAEDIEEIKTVCFCGEKATQNLRLINGQVVMIGEEVAIDGKDNVSYESVCSKHRVLRTGRRFYQD